MRSKLLGPEEARFIFGASVPGPDQDDDQQDSLYLPAAAVLKVAIERDLTQRQRDCVRMYYYEGMTMEQIGAQLDVGKSTVFRHLQRAKGRLKRAFEYAEALRSATK